MKRNRFIFALSACLLAASTSTIPAQPATLYFQATEELGALNQSWLSPSNWYYSLTPLVGADRVPTSADSVILTTSPVIIGPNNVAVQTMITVGDIAIGGGDIKLVNLITSNADVSFTGSTVTVQSAWDLYYGASLNGSTVIMDAGAGLLLESNSFLNVNNSTLYVIGGIILQDKSGIAFGGGTNQLSILPSASLSGAGRTSVTAAGGTLLFDNNGIVQGNTGLLSISLDNTVWTNSLGLGTYATTSSNATIEMLGSVTFPSNSTNLVVGPGLTWFWANDPLSILGVLQVGALDPSTMRPDPGTVLLDPNLVEGNGLLHVLGSPGQPSTLLLDDGTIRGPVIQIDPYGQLVLTNSYTTTISGGTISNAGTTFWPANGGSFYLANGAGFNNLPGALFDVLNTNNAVIGSGAGVASVFNNAGTFRKSASTNITVLSSIFVNTGLLDVQTGTMELGPGTNSGQFNIPSGSQLSFSFGTNVQLAGSSFTGAGLVLLSFSDPDLWLNTDVTIPNLQVGGTYGSGRVDGPGHLTISGALNVGGGTLLGSGAVNVDSAATFATSYSGATLARSVNNNGSAVLATGMTASQTITWNNLPGSVFEMQNGITLSFSYSGVPPALDNAGLFTNSPGSGQTFNWALTNSGSVQLGPGSYLECERGFTQTAGNTFVAAGAALEAIVNGSAVLVLGGTLGGVGTIQGTVVNSGVIHPGDAPGSLTIADGSFTGSSTGTLSIEIGGPSSSGQFSQLDLTYCQAALGGALNVTFENGFVPAVGDRYSIISDVGAAVSGVFPALNGQRPANGVVLVPVYSSSGVALAVANDLIVSSPALIGNTFSFSFPTTAGLTNIVEYTSSLAPANWQTLSNVVGHGSPALISDPSATSPQRFYRVSFK